MTVNEIQNFTDAFVVRSIRNECRTFMTRHKKKIGWIEQALWFLGKYSSQHDIGKLFVYIFYFGAFPIGYGLVRVDGNKAWISGGLKEHARGQGFGTELFKTLVEMWNHKTLYLEVLDFNLAGYKIYTKLGFKEIKKEGSVITMKRARDKNENRIRTASGEPIQTNAKMRKLSSKPQRNKSSNS